jgi:hypothetical protein
MLHDMKHALQYLTLHQPWTPIRLGTERSPRKIKRDEPVCLNQPLARPDTLLIYAGC